MPQRKPQRFSTNVNDRVGDWLIVAHAHPTDRGSKQVSCRCERCGAEKVVRVADLAAGKSRGDGCYRRQLMMQSRIKTGHQPRGARSLTAKSLRNLLRRYGHRVDQGLRELSAFIAAVGERPSPAHHLRVIDPSAEVIDASGVRWELRRNTTIPKKVARAARRVAARDHTPAP